MVRISPSSLARRKSGDFSVLVKAKKKGGERGGEKEKEKEREERRKKKEKGEKRKKKEGGKKREREKRRERRERRERSGKEIGEVNKLRDSMRNIVILLCDLNVRLRLRSPPQAKPQLSS